MVHRPFSADGPRSRGLEVKGPNWREQVDRAEKKELVTTLSEVFANTGVIVVAHNLGLTVPQMNDLRGRMAGAGGRLKVAKNRLVRLALDGTQASGLSDILTGPMVLAYSADPVAAPKIATEFAKLNDKLVVVGGAFGAMMLDASGVKALAELPSLDDRAGSPGGSSNIPTGPRPIRSWTHRRHWPGWARSLPSNSMCRNGGSVSILRTLSTRPPSAPSTPIGWCSTSTPGQGSVWRSAPRLPGRCGSG